MKEGKADIVVNTKVTAEAYARLKAICKRYGFTLYDMLQMLCDCIIRFMDDKHNLSDNLLRIIRMFQDMPGWKTATRLTEPIDEAQIMEAFYVWRHPNGTGDSRIVHVERPMLDGDSEGWIATHNIQLQLERFIELTTPSLYRHLRLLAADLGTESMFDTLNIIANLYKENEDEKELRLQFEQNDWHEGARMHDRQQYKRGYARTIDGSDSQQQNLFDNDKN